MTPGPDCSTHCLVATTLFTSSPSTQWVQNFFFFYITHCTLFGCKFLSFLFVSLWTQRKLLKRMSRNALSSRFSFCCPTIVLFCPGAPKPWLLLSYQRTVLTVNDPQIFISHRETITVKSSNFNVSLFFQKLAVVTFLNSSVCLFQRSVTHSRAACAAHQAITTKAKVCGVSAN
jgi:hypothetical protein